jgi:hypothetical protein
MILDEALLLIVLPADTPEFPPRAEDWPVMASSSGNSAPSNRRLDVLMAVIMFMLSESLFFSKNSLTS